jgi:hypothetical protein
MVQGRNRNGWRMKWEIRLWKRKREVRVTMKREIRGMLQ